MQRPCIICDNQSFPKFVKLGVQYWLCDNCETLFSGELDNSNKVGGEYEVERNEQQNHLRIARIDEMIYGSNKEDVHILDFGCGNGMLIEDLKKAGYVHVDGYDAYNPKYDTPPQREKYHIVTMIECIEHLSEPFSEIDVICRALKSGGCAMIESSFTDVAKQDNIPLEEFFYVAPQSGHSTIFSHHGIDVIFSMKGFRPRQHFDRNVRFFQKR